MSDNTNSAQEKRENKILLTSVGVLVLICIVLAIIGFCFLGKPADIIEGQADATSVRISGKLPGRVVEIFVHEGDMVHKGDTLIH
ncbi:MAG: biotin/lipoyl-binding protein, partial [Muribaculaceae bacterium]|nr:biotin/lipoyl-binding protein [Muribaculaceae bacterium]